MYIPKCPFLRDETKDIFRAQTKSTFLLEDRESFYITTRNTSITTRGATTTFGFFEIIYKKVGEKPDLEAIEYNKKVKECQIINGEF